MVLEKRKYHNGIFMELCLTHSPNTQADKTNEGSIHSEIYGVEFHKQF
jgi:hypothetical protein